MKILYLGWIGYQNIGDELMFENFKELATQTLGNNTVIVSKMCNENYDEFDGFDIICLGGGSILIEGFIKVLNRALDSKKKVMIWGSAYDSYLTLDDIDKIEKMGVSYVFSDEAEEMLERIARESIYFSVRGPITYTILKGSNINMEKIKISGDPGFLLNDANIVNPYGFTKKDKVVGINIGTAFNKVYGFNEKKVLNELQEYVDFLLEKGYKIYLYTMWKDDINIVLNFYKNIKNTKNVFLDIDIRKGNELLSIIKHCIFTINLKLHANIISSVAGIPFVAICYRLKGYDFTRSIDCQDLTVSTNDEHLSTKIDKIVLYIMANYTELVEKIELNINQYRFSLNKSLDSLK